MSVRPYITCRELITFLGDYLAGELPAEKVHEFERHLAVCASCRAYIATYEEAIRMARAGAEHEEIPEAPEELIEAVLASLGG